VYSNSPPTVGIFSRPLMAPAGQYGAFDRVEGSWRRGPEVLRLQGGVEGADALESPVTLLGDDVVSPLVPLQDHSGILEFLEVKEQVASPKAGQVRESRERLRFGGERLDDPEAVPVCKRLEYIPDQDLV